MRHRVSLGLVVLAALVALSFVGCGGATVSSIQGYVKDDAGKAIQNITVSYLAPEASKALATVTTDVNGYYSITKLTPGSYTLVFTPPIANNAVAYMAQKVGVTMDTFNTGNITAEVDVTLPRLGASLTGVLMVQTPTGAPYAVAQGKKVFLTYPSGYKFPSVVSGAVVLADYATTTVGAAGAFTFSGLPFSSMSSCSLKVEVAANEAITSNDAGYLSATLPSNLSFEYGINTAIDMSDRPITVTATTNPALDLVSTSAADANGVAVPVAVDGSIVLTFNNTLANKYTSDTGNRIQLGGAIVQATVTVSGKTLTFKPAANLLKDSTYTLYYKASDGITADKTGNFNFTTVASTLPTIADLAWDTTAKVDADNGGTGAYDNNAAVFYISFAYDKTFTYSLYYKAKDADAWTSGGAIPAANIKVSGATGFATVTGPTLVSGNTVSLKVRASAGTAYTDSNVITTADGIAPSSVTIAGTAVNAGNNTNAIGGALNVDRAVTATVDGMYNFTITLGGEPMGAPTVAVATGSNNITVTAVEMNKPTDPTSATVYITVKKNTAFGGQQVKVSAIADAAGNALDVDAATTGAQPTQPITVTF